MQADLFSTVDLPSPSKDLVINVENLKRLYHDLQGLETLSLDEINKV